MPAEFHAFDTAWRKATSLAVKDSGGTLRTLTEAHYHDGTAWRQVFSAFTVNIPAVQPQNFDASAVDIFFGNEGDLDYDVNSIITDGGSWGSPETPGVGASYWLRGTLGVGNGTMNGAALGVWHSLSSARQFWMSAAPAGVSRERTVLFEIATDSGGSNIIDSQNITFTSDRS
jgi:hypothetical protein